MVGADGWWAPRDGYSTASFATSRLALSPDHSKIPPSHMQLFVLGYGDKEVARHASLTPPEDGRPRVHSAGVASAETVVLAAARARAQVVAHRPRHVQTPWPKGSALSSTSSAPTWLEENFADTDSDDGAGSASEGDRPHDEHPDAFANAMRVAVRIGQMFSVMPVDAKTGSRSRRRAVYAYFVSSGLSILTILSAVKQFSNNKLGLVDVMVIMFYLMSALTSWLFVRLGHYWNQLLKAFRRQERRHGVCPGLRKKLNTMVSVLLGVSFVEHSLSEMNGIIGLSQAHPNVSTFGESLEIYVRANYNMVFIAIGYWPPLAPFLFFLNFVATFVWNFNDLFIILLGVSLASRFRFLRESIANSLGLGIGVKTTEVPALGKAYWRSARRAYNALSNLARLMDQALSMQLLVSFINNLYFICMQLLRGFNDPGQSWYATLYIMFSFAFLVARTSAVSLLAASVHDQSKAVQDVLYCVCSEDYNDEVYRFLIQVTSEDVALSGCNMFKVTRSLLLTVAGTILTYEVVLVQLH